MKNKRGFTLMELLVVIAIVGVVGVASVISFTSIKDETAEKELKNKYIEIQRGANLYLDLHLSDQNWFIESRRIDIKLSDLRSENYISSDLSNPVTGGVISEEYYVRLCIIKDDQNEDVVDSCIIERSSSGIKYIADSYGIENGHCCE